MRVFLLYFPKPSIRQWVPLSGLLTNGPKLIKIRWRQVCVKAGRLLLFICEFFSG